MADPLSIASGVAGLVSLTIQATQLTCQFVAEVSHAGETALQCLGSLSLLRDVLERVQESQRDASLVVILERQAPSIPADEIRLCENRLEDMLKGLKSLFNEDGKIKKRHAIMWPFKKTESADLIQHLQRLRSTFSTLLAVDSLGVSVKSHQIAVETREGVRDMQHGIETQKFLEWLFPKDTTWWQHVGDKTPGSHEVTSGWFLETQHFRQWLTCRDGRVLWCQGAPGSGKSVLIQQAISWLESDLGSATLGEEQPRVYSHFFHHQDTRTQSLEAVVRHLMYQAAMQSDAVLYDLQSCPRLQELKKNRSLPRPDDMQSIFFDICVSGRDPFIALDGLDECPEDLDGSGARQELLQFITEAASRGARVLTASRDLADIREALGDCYKVRVRAPDSDIREYATERLAGMERRVPQAKTLKVAVIDKVVKDSDGLFLLARLMLDLVAPTTIKNVRQIKKFLHQSSWELDDMYQATLTRIMSNDEASVDLARKILVWICYSERPLCQEELQHAIATEEEDDDFDPDGITPSDLLQACCMGVVVCDEKGIFSLFHQTAYEFFRASPDLQPTVAHLLISKTCLTYLSFSVLRREGACPNLDALEKRKSELRLLDYAAKHWFDHARQVEDRLVESILSFLDDDGLLSALSQAFFHHKRVDSELQARMFDSLPTGTTKLQIVCGRGLPVTASRLLSDKTQTLSQADDQGWTALIGAASWGHVNLVDLLLAQRNVQDIDKEGDVDVGLNQADKAGWTPLFWGIIKGHQAVVEHLLAAGASTGIRDSNNWTPIDWVAFRGDKSLITLLLQHTAQPTVDDGPAEQARVPRRRGAYNPQHFSPLFLAAAAGDRESFDALFEHGRTEALKGTDGALLHVYAMLNKMERFYRHRADYGFTSMPSVMVTDSFTIRLFESAIRCDQLAVVKILVELGGPLGAIVGEEKQRSALHIAACSGKPEVCEYLLQRGADPSLKDIDEHSPLDLAIIVGHVPCISLFLRHDSQSPVDSVYIARGNALAILARGLDYSLVSRGFRNSRLKLDLQPQVGHQAIHMMGSTRHDPSLHAVSLLKYGKADDEEQAMQVETSDIIQTMSAFLDRGCDINAREDGNHEMALHAACRLQRPDLVSFLVRRGADVNAKGQYEETPLYQACDREEVLISVICTLVEAGADVNMENQFSRSPLLEACYHASPEVIRLLTANGAQVNTFDNLSRHPLHSLCRRPADRHAGTVELIDHILDLAGGDDGADVLSKRCEHYGPGSFRAKPTPLSLAIEAENWPAVELLIARGADPHDVDTGHITSALWRHAMNPRGPEFQRLLRYGADLSIPVPDIPIITRCLKEYLDSGRGAHDGFEDCVAVLVETGADINAAGGYGYSDVLSAACDRQASIDFIRILLNHGADAAAVVTKHPRVFFHVENKWRDEVTGLFAEFQVAVPEKKKEKSDDSD